MELKQFLVDRSGQVVDRFAPSTEPEKMACAIEKLLAGGIYQGNGPDSASECA